MEGSGGEQQLIVRRDPLGGDVPLVAATNLVEVAGQDGSCVTIEMKVWLHGPMRLPK